MGGDDAPANVRAASSAAKPSLTASLGASSVAALVNFPLWRASAIAQSGFTMDGGARLSGTALWAHAFQPPFRGVSAVLAGMAWARAAIFYGSSAGKDALLKRGAPESVALVAPPIVVSTFVQLVNMPIIRASITLQHPECEHRTTRAAIRALWNRGRVDALWHGTSAGIVKTVPKYVTAVFVKDTLEIALADVRFSTDARQDGLMRSAVKSIAAGVCGATLTNPADVLRNEMFKTDLGLREALSSLNRGGMSWMWRGVDKNLVAVAVPIALTIFMTDRLQANGW